MYTDTEVMCQAKETIKEHIITLNQKNEELSV